jgi:hypothetical protein
MLRCVIWHSDGVWVFGGGEHSWLRHVLWAETAFGNERWVVYRLRGTGVLDDCITVVYPY